jgi:hypothetical protein
VKLPAESQATVNGVADGLTSATRPTSPDVEVAGSFDGREAFVAGEADTVISGVGFTAEQKDALAKAGKGYVVAPFNAVGLTVFGFVPPFSTYPVGCEEDDTCVENRQFYSGAIRFTPNVLAKAMFEGINLWRDPEFVPTVDLPAGRFYQPPINRPRAIVRSDLDATNQYLEQYLQLAAPAAHAAWRKQVPGYDPNLPPAEIWPNTFTSSRLGQDNVLSQIREGLDPGSSIVSLGGTVGFAAPSLVKESLVLNAQRPPSGQVPLFEAQLKNAAGEWVTATSASISKAVSVGEGIPNTGSVGLSVPGAYPITWVNSLYAPTKGLSPDKANAVAALIRWQVSAGQSSARLEQLVDGKLTDKMVLQALGAADEVVRSNCAAAGGSVEKSTGAGGSAPSGGFPGLGAVSYCVAASTPTTTVLEPSNAEEVPTDSSPTEFASGDIPLDAGVSDLPASEVLGETTSNDLSADGSPDPTDTSDGSSTGSGGGSGNGGSSSVVAAMPYGVPGQQLPPLDRAATLGLGALAYVGIRKFQRGRG